MLESLMDHLEHRFSELELRRQANDAFSLVVNDACGLDDVSCVIQDTVGPYDEIVTQRAGPYLRFSHRDYNKGTSLAFVASRFGVPPVHAAIFGDGHNDLDAMRHLPEAFRCCPSNAAEEVKAMVACGHGIHQPGTAHPRRAGRPDAWRVPPFRDEGGGSGKRTLEKRGTPDAGKIGFRNVLSMKAPAEKEESY